MKTFLLFLTLLPLAAVSQSYMMADGQFVNANNSFRPGVILSGGGFLKNSDDNNRRTFRLGAGIGVYVFEHGTSPYIPVFLEAGYFNRSAKITPYVNARAGYAFYKGSAHFVGINGGNRGGLYFNMSGGVGLRLAKPVFFVPSVGLTIVNLRQVIQGENIASYNKALLSIGATLFFTK